MKKGDEQTSQALPYHSIQKYLLGYISIICSSPIIFHLLETVLSCIFLFLMLISFAQYVRRRHVKHWETHCGQKLMLKTRKNCLLT